MKSIFLLLVLIVSGCNGQNTRASAKVGDCFMDYERISVVGSEVYKVLEVGEYSLKVVNSQGYIGVTNFKTIPNQVDCFDRFNFFK